MLAETLQLWKRSVGQGGTWTVLVWMLASGVVLTAVFGLLAVIALQSSHLFPFHPGVNPFGSPLVPAPLPLGGTAPFGHPPFFAPTALRAFIGPLVAMLFVYLAVVPFMAAGIYGTLSRAIMGDPVTWGTFWTMARRLYTRAWGLIAYAICYLVALAVVTAILFAVVKGFALVLVGLGPFFSIPLWVRMMGGLFMDERRFGESFRRSFGGGHYWGILGGSVLGAVVMSIGMLVLLGLSHLTALFGIVYFLASIALTVAAPSWFLALYRAATPLT
jgi:hypothetical protein